MPPKTVTPPCPQSHTCPLVPKGTHLPGPVPPQGLCTLAGTSRSHPVIPLCHPHGPRAVTGADPAAPPPLASCLSFPSAWEEGTPCSCSEPRHRPGNPHPKPAGPGISPLPATRVSRPQGSLSPEIPVTMVPDPYGVHVPRVSRSQGPPSPECPLPRGSLSPRDPCPRAGRGTPAPGSVPRETLQQQPGVFTSGSRREPCNYSPGHGALSFPGWEAAEHTHTTHRHPKPTPNPAQSSESSPIVTTY